MNELPFVFIVGFNKTGTMSIHNFFKMNGFPSIHFGDGNNLALTMVANCVNGQKILSGYDQQFKVFSDLCFTNHNVNIEANKFFRILDRDYPKSYFIYNNRNTEDWIESRLNHTHKGVSMVSRFLSIYNTSNVDVLKAAWRLEKELFEKDIKSYFGSSSFFLELDIECSNVSELIGNFLGMTFNAEHWRQHNKTKLA